MVGTSRHFDESQHLEFRRLVEVGVALPWLMKEKCEGYRAASPSTQAPYVNAIHMGSSSPSAGIVFANEELARQIRAFENC